MYVGLILVLVCDLDASEDSRVRTPRVVVEEEIAEDEDNRNCNHARPYLRYDMRRYSQVTQLFCNETRLADG